MSVEKMREEMKDAYEDLIGEPWDEAGLHKQAWCEAWERSWIASRGAIEVDLPKFEDYPASMELEMQQSLREILETLGLTVKP